MIMTRPTPAEARKEIAGLIGRSVSQARTLKESLEVERSALEDQDADALEDIVVSKNDCAEQLQTLDLQRSALCESWGFTAGPGQMDEIIDWCDEDDLIDQGWSQLMQLAADGNTLNLTNGAIIRLRQQQFETSLSLLRGVTPGSDTYGRNGAESGDLSRHSLAEA
jgi:flagellar biosynthesis/type III secretory pathway chaperone